MTDICLDSLRDLYKNSRQSNEKHDLGEKQYYKQKAGIHLYQKDKLIRGNAIEQQKKDTNQQFLLENLYIIDLLYKKKRCQIESDLSSSLLNSKVDIKSNKVDKKNNCEKLNDLHRFHQINVNQQEKHLNEINTINFYIDQDEGVYRGFLNYIFISNENNQKPQSNSRCKSRRNQKKRGKKNLFNESTEDYSDIDY